MRSTALIYYLRTTVANRCSVLPSSYIDSFPPSKAEFTPSGDLPSSREELLEQAATVMPGEEDNNSERLGILMSRYVQN